MGLKVSSPRRRDDEIQTICDATVKRLGAWLARTNNTVYQAATDGFVLARSAFVGNPNVIGLTDGSDPPTVVRIQDQSNTGGAGSCIASITMPVKKDDYWKVTGAATVYWIPLEP